MPAASAAPGSRPRRGLRRRRRPPSSRQVRQRPPHPARTAPGPACGAWRAIQELGPRPPVGRHRGRPHRSVQGRGRRAVLRSAFHHDVDRPGLNAHAAQPPPAPPKRDRGDGSRADHDRQQQPDEEDRERHQQKSTRCHGDENRNAARPRKQEVQSAGLWCFPELALGRHVQHRSTIGYLAHATDVASRGLWFKTCLREHAHPPKAGL